MEQSQFCEHSVKQKIEGKWVLKRVLYIALPVSLLLLFTFVGLVQKNVLPYIVVALLVDVPLFLFTWRTTKLEYEYTMTGGVLTFSHVYGGSSRKLIFETDLKTIHAAFAYASEKGRKALNEYAPEVQYFALPSENEADNAEREVWCCLFEGEDGKRTAFYFELTDKAYRFLRTYAPTRIVGERIRGAQR
ncbi:MAG: hypothetical protein J6B77_03415 [Clostridia bacterium]|nr:hypothetical protein [Clostridia bacterium]